MERKQRTLSSTTAHLSQLDLSEFSEESDETRLTEQKASRILVACENLDLEELAALATSEDGLLMDRLRRTAWPILLGCSARDPTQSANTPKTSSHPDESQVKLDVNRSFVYYPQNETEKQLDRRKEELQYLITTILRQHPRLSYFQGFHDIVQVFLLVLGREASVCAISRLALLRIRDFMLPTMAGAIAHLHLLPSILEAADHKVANHLLNTQPFFALAATLTLYAHDIQEYGEIARLFDFLLAQEAVMSLYLFAVIICSRKDELLEVEADEPEVLHSILSKLPKPLNLEVLINRALDLFERCPPEKLPSRAWRQISSFSVLKTTRDRLSLSQQSLEDGEKLFAKHAAQIRFHQLLSKGITTLWRFRRPSGAISIALLAVFFSWWFKSPHYTSWFATWDWIQLFWKSSPKSYLSW